MNKLLFEEVGEHTYVNTSKDHANPNHEAGEVVTDINGSYFIPSSEGVYLNESDLLDIISFMRRP